MQVKKILTIFAKPGMTVAKDVITQDNILLIPKGTILNEYRILRLKSYSIRALYIEIPQETKNKNSEEISTDSNLTYSKQIKASKEFKQFHMDYDKNIEDFRVQLNEIVSNNDTIDADHLLEETRNLIKSSRNSLHLFDMIHNIRDYDDLTFAHSINVSMICNIIGRWLHYSQEDIDALTLAGLLHDIGKLIIPHEIITKPDRLTPQEYSIIKTHPLHGYNIVKDKNIDERVKLAVLEHHERCDGSGYPNGKKDAEIHDFSKIVAIADVYDAMTSNRVYRKGICPFDVIEQFEKDGFLKYDMKFLQPFLNGVVQTYMNNSVQLNNGKIGKIIMLNNQSLSRPVIQVENQFIDTSKEKSVHIESII